MGKHRSKKDAAPEKPRAEDETAASSTAALDPSLNALFQSSLVSSEKVPKQKYELVVKPARSKPQAHTEALLPDPDANDGLEGESSDEAPAPTEKSKKKRKRKDEHDNIETDYLQRLEREQEKAHSKKQKRPKHAAEDQEPSIPNLQNDNNEGGAGSEAEEDAKSEASSFEIPQHESQAPSAKDIELEKAERTVFLSNVASSAVTSKADRRVLMSHLSSFFGDTPKQEKTPKIESLRFRSTAFATAAIPKKAAFAKGELMDATTKGTNAYVVYSTSIAAREAVRKLNATMVLDRHVRFDSVAHPSRVDNRRCVFVGNLGFVDDESQIRAAEAGDNAKPSKAKNAGDVEEGLWRQFMKAGAVESVRVVRDKDTRVGKGFAYVQFKDQNSVERALAFNEKRYPPLLPRILRVTRAKKMSKTSSRLEKGRAADPQPGKIYNPRKSPEDMTRAGRAKKLLGHSGSLLFEGTRAKQGKDHKSGKVQPKRKGKPQTRSSRRGAAYKAAQKQG